MLPASTFRTAAVSHTTAVAAAMPRPWPPSRSPATYPTRGRPSDSAKFQPAVSASQAGAGNSRSSAASGTSATRTPADRSCRTRARNLIVLLTRPGNADNRLPAGPANRLSSCPPSPGLCTEDTGLIRQAQPGDGNQPVSGPARMAGLLFHDSQELPAGLLAASACLSADPAVLKVRCMPLALITAALADGHAGL